MKNTVPWRNVRDSLPKPPDFEKRVEAKRRELEPRMKRNIANRLKKAKRPS